MTRRYFLALLVFTLHLGAAESPEYGLLSQSVTLKPDVKTSAAPEILWKHNGDKVVEFNGREQQTFSPYEGRVTLDWHSAELEITGLRYEDNGNYDLELYVNKQLHRFPFKLMVIDRVSKPTITCMMKKDANSGESEKQATLICSAESRQSEPLMRFEWSLHGDIYPGPNLTISLDNQHSDGKYNCTVSNPLSAETTIFTVKECYPEKNSTALIVGIVIAVIAVIAILAALGLLLFWKLRQKRKPEENKVNAEQKPLLQIHPTSQSPHQPETGGMNAGMETNKTPVKPPRSLPESLSPAAVNFSNVRLESGFNAHKKDSDLEEENQPREGNKGNDEQEPSTEAASQDSSSTPQSENTEPGNVRKKMETDMKTNWTPEKPSLPPKPSSTAHKKESDLEEEKQSGDISKHTEELKPNSDSKKSPPEGVENTDQSTEEQTSMLVESETNSANGSKQDDKKIHDDGEEDDSQHSEGPIGHQQGSPEDSVASPDSTAATADKQGSSRHSSQSEVSPEEAGGGERLNKKPDDDVEKSDTATD